MRTEKDEGLICLELAPVKATANTIKYTKEIMKLPSDGLGNIIGLAVVAVLGASAFALAHRFGHTKVNDDTHTVDREHDVACSD